MKQIKKLSLLLAFSIMATISFAQLTIGLKAGFNLATISTDDSEFDPKYLPTFQAGAVIDFGLTDNLGVQTGVSFMGKGYKVNEELLGSDFIIESNVYYLQIPAHLMFKTSNFFVGAGPFIGMGIAGKYRAEYAGVEDSEDLEFGNTEDDDISPVDFGVGVQLGVMLGQIRIGAGYDLGLANTIPKDIRSDDEYIRNNVINVFAAYMF